MVPVAGLEPARLAALDFESFAPLFSILTEILDFGGTLEGCDPQTEHNSTRSRFINHKYIIAYFSAIDNILSEKEVSL